MSTRRDSIEAALAELPDMRAPLPLAFGDPAFVQCLHEAFGTAELVANFDRLCGANLMARQAPLERMIDEATGKRDDDMRAFVEFVHDCIYLRLPNAAIHALRLSADTQELPTE